jgi:hypothetical protein
MFPSVDSQLMEMARKSMNPTERRVRRSLSARILHRMKGLKDLSNWVVAPSHWVPRLRSYFVILTCLSCAGHSRIWDRSKFYHSCG